MAVIWDVLCSLVEVYQHFGSVYCLQQQGNQQDLTMETASTSEMSVNFHQTTKHNIPEDTHLYEQYFSTQHCCEK
jgi:hypothetical protein